jgi:hypothetical protein
MYILIPKTVTLTVDNEGTPDLQKREGALPRLRKGAQHFKPLCLRIG